MGPWNPDNEDWFLNRFNLYVEGKGALLSVDEWSKKMKGFKESMSMMSTLNSQCAAFISS